MGEHGTVRIILPKHPIGGSAECGLCVQVQMNRVRHERKVLEERLKVNREKQGDLDHGAGNEKALLDKAKKEGDAHARHISHLKGLQSAKTMERVQRRNAARLGKKLQQDAADQLQTSLWAKTRVGANKLSLARKMRAGAQGAKVAVREADDGPIDAGKMSSVMLQDSGYRRSSSNVNQLKVAVDATALPGAKGEVELHLQVTLPPPSLPSPLAGALPLGRGPCQPCFLCVSQNLSESDDSDDGRP